MKKKYDRRCLQCKQKFSPPYPNSVVCGIPCSIEYGKKLRLKEVKKLDQDWKKQKRVRKQALKTLGELEGEARREYQKFIRLRDANEPCISCGCTTAKQWDGGHFFKAELFTGYIFEEPLCNKQCSRCNDLYSGNELQYRIGLVKKIGEVAVKAYEENQNNARFYKFTRQELIEKKEYYRAKIKELKNV